MLVIELNEFSVDFLRAASAHLSTPMLDKVLGWPCCRTNSAEKTERFGLDPWVQWVSIHTGIPAQEHGVAHLGEADKLTHEQIWDRLNGLGVSTAVWGAMNGRNNKHPLMHTFFPDPWTYSEIAAPAGLNSLLALPRLYAQDYVRPNRWSLFRSGLRTGSYLLLRQPAVILRNVGAWTSALAKGGFNNATLFALFDNLSAKLFARFCSRDDSAFKLIFFNSIAHLQHHDWRPDSAKVQAVISLLENTLASVLETVADDEPVMVANAFSQVCTTTREEFLYRPVDPPGFVEALKINCSRVEQMMTNDGHIFFDDVASCDEAHAILAGITVNGQRAFDVDRRGDTQLFYQFLIWEKLPEGALIEVGQRSLRFYDYFEQLVQRTGSHIASGEVFYANTELPDEMWNYELFHKIEASYV